MKPIMQVNNVTSLDSKILRRRIGKLNKRAARQ